MWLLWKAEKNLAANVEVPLEMKWVCICLLLLVSWLRAHSERKEIKEQESESKSDDAFVGMEWEFISRRKIVVNSLIEEIHLIFGEVSYMCVYMQL